MARRSPPPVRRPLDEEERRQESDRFTATLGGFAIALLLALVGLYLLQELARISKLEDCLLQGRSNCARIEMWR
jgi:hypothetical protein